MRYPPAAKPATTNHLRGGGMFVWPAGKVPAGAARRFAQDAGGSKPPLMLVVHVHVHVKPEAVEAFRAASIANARASRQEPGIARFDVLQQADDPARFILVEVYRTAAATAAHKETAHYAAWRDAVASLQAEPRFSVKLDDVFPAEA